MNALYATRLHFDRAVVGGVVTVHDRWQHVHVTVRVLAGKVLERTPFKRTIEPLRDACLLLAVRREEVNVVLTKKHLHLSVGELVSLVFATVLACDRPQKCAPSLQ